MDRKLFEQQYLCRIPPRDPIFERAKAAWLRYLRETHAFDAKVCTGIGREGKPAPATPEERYRSQTFAGEQKMLWLDQLAPAIPRDKWQAARFAAWKEFDAYG